MLSNLYDCQKYFHLVWLFKALTKLRASVLHFAFFPGGQTNSEQLKKMVGWILDSQLNKSVKNTGEKDLVRVATSEGTTPLAFALCHTQVTEEIVDLVKDIEDKQLPFVLNMVASRLRQQEGQPAQRWDYLKPFVKKLEHWEDTTIQKQVLNIICQHNNRDLLEWIYNNAKVSLYLTSLNFG